MTNRRVRLSLLTSLMAGSLLAAPAAFAWGPAAAAPTATCSISGVLPGGTVHLSGGGFTPGAAFLSSPTAAGGSFTIGADGGFQMANVENGSYTVSQGNDRTQCSGFKETEKTDGTDKTEQEDGHEENNQKHENQKHDQQNQQNNQHQDQNDEDDSR
ncbi:hypothetical protein [Streptomyces antarcticus]|uniref:hypothetical protein n=1 Tax=Streptomyces antarcticus TaxID=2996458 RepID=UPI00226E15DC|nr:MULTISPECIES: hypothetical protein [unclassified Streptomyces]MCY0947345.1 hypothetical protein [Streptomyces sp. H34-AA3]MCZ4086484.1 hypothetical protein [Streptomyces sp. H34-S5]